MRALSTCGEPDEIKNNTHPKNVAARVRHQVVGTKNVEDESKRFELQKLAGGVTVTAPKAGARLITTEKTASGRAAKHVWARVPSLMTSAHL